MNSLRNHGVRGGTTHARNRDSVVGQFESLAGVPKHNGVREDLSRGRPQISIGHYPPTGIGEADQRMLADLSVLIGPWGLSSVRVGDHPPAASERHIRG